MSAYSHAPNPSEERAAHLRDIAKRIEPAFPAGADELRGIAAALAAADPAPTQPDAALSDEERVREVVERCLRLRNEDGTHKVPAEARNIIRAAMDAARAAQPSHIDIEVQLTNDERLKISAVVHQNYYMPNVFAVVQQIKADALAARAAQPVPAPEVSRGVAEVCDGHGGLIYTYDGGQFGAQTVEEACDECAGWHPAVRDALGGERGEGA